MNPVLMVWNLRSAGVKPFANFSKEILQGFEASSGCCESIVDGLKSPGGCREAICILFQRTIDGFEFPGGSCAAISIVF